jgi:hypothetical protein
MGGSEAKLVCGLEVSWHEGIYGAKAMRYLIPLAQLVKRRKRIPSLFLDFNVGLGRRMGKGRGGSGR